MSRLSPLTASLLSALVVLLGLGALEYQQREALRDQTQMAVLHEMGSIRAHLEMQLNGSLLLSRGIVAHILTDPDDPFRHMDTTLRELAVEEAPIRNLAIALGSHVVYVHPLQDNEAVLGTDYRDLPEQWPSIERAFETRQPVVNGPVNLVQGGTGIIHRAPVFRDGTAGEDPPLGVVSIVIDIETLIARSGVLAAQERLDIALRGSEGQMIWGNPALFLNDDAVFLEIAFPSGSWSLAARSKEPLALARSLWPLRLVGLLLAVLLLALPWLVARWGRQQRQARQAVEESEMRYRAVLDNLRDGVFVHDMEGRILDVNREACSVLGYSRAELLSMSITDLDVFVDQEALRHSLKRLHHMSSLSIETINRSKDGTAIPIQVRAGLMRVGGEPLVVACVRDITEAKRHEEERATLLADLRRSNDELQQFAFIASHDLQEPLRMVASYVQLLERRYGPQLDADGRQFISFAAQGAKRMRQLIIDLLDYSRLDSESTPLLPVDSQTAVTMALANLGTAIGDTGASVEVGPLPYVTADQIQLTRLFQNLLGNAMKYRRDDLPPRIQVTARPVEDIWEFSVTDNGIGIDPEYRERIFKIFQRLHPIGRYEGTGIGLAICKRIVDRHGGRIWVESAPEGGSVFRFTLPDVRIGSGPKEARNLARPAASLEPAGRP
ncbi:ATP-binding protein [Telmatospirillum sp. J64-1]|uniref:ATP-binding protein n=1 Tax=Telmatospirillum sp. J64-1 TaxID=2502183 RepID=UPI00115D4C4D|nr:ATP-binding protein [Telmatospirillum sp. J64-1]